MRNLVFLYALTSLLASCVQGNRSTCADEHKLVNRSGLQFLPDDKEPFTGDACTTHASGAPRSQGHYVNGLPAGIFSFWNADGSKEHEDQYADNGQMVQTTTFYPGTGQKSAEDDFKNSLHDGQCRMWWPNGQLKSEENYTAGKHSGTSTGWFENGQKAWERSYAADQVVGEERTWYDTGKPQSVTLFCGSSPLVKEAWDVSGKKISNQSDQSTRGIEDALVATIRDLQLSHIGVSAGKWAYECFTDADLVDFRREKIAEGIHVSLKTDCRFLSLGIGFRKLSSGARERVRQVCLRTFKPTWAALGRITPLGQTDAGQMAERLVAQAVVAALDDLSKKSVDDLIAAAR